MTESSTRLYRGRFAPSPTGPLHFGSLLAATASYLQAKQQQGQWLLRIEDLDPPREVPGAAEAFLYTLEAFGFEWDGEVCWQSRRLDHYEAILDELLQQGLAYRCACSRKAITQQAEQLGLQAGIYRGHCRSRHVSAHQQHAVRLLTEGARIRFVDAVQGEIQQDLDREVGDFVLRRADGFIAYQLAVVVDDAAHGITEVVRGSDLLDSTPRQIFLQQQLGYARPDYLHLPVAVNPQGQKLSKQSFAAAISPADALHSLWQALNFLGQQAPVELLDGGRDDLWRWAREHWQAQAIPRKLAIPYPSESPSNEH
ncbi:MAG: tRNA glutamyl-Q(34) synthetase GluQRS [Thiohalomonadaceae bacterium]